MRISPMTAKALRKTLEGLRNPEIAAHSQRFFKTGPGEYGEGDRFLGIRVPVLRKQAQAFQDMPLRSVRASLRSHYHEERLCAVLILVRQFEAGDASEREEIYRMYLDNSAYINNWDLVDSSAHKIVGPFLEDRDRDLLESLARSDDMWERRIGIIATLHFIKQNDFGDTLAIADILLNDPEDLIHKAVGWMLREVGNRNPALERAFLKPRYRDMPRTMLRYAIEKFPDAERKQYLNGLV